jgi:iron(III) transport system ATP-binding protein
MSELVVRGLTKSFGATPVLRGIDLTVPQGALVAVLGPSGCGKTTFLRLVAGFERADAGEIVIAGATVARGGSGVPPERRRVGVVPQEGALFPHLSVAGNVAFGLPRGSHRAARVAEMLELAGLAGYGERMPHQLSGGQQQRVALARALAPEPALVLLDEPFSALDTGLRAAVRDDVRTALHAAGATAVLVTHDQQEALSMADLVAVMRDGRVVQAAAPGELYAQPGDVGVATFVGEAVVLAAEVRDGVARCALGSLPVRGRAPAGLGTVVIRPEQVQIGPRGHGIPARVATTSFFGHDALVRLDLVNGSAGAAEVIARTQGPQPLLADDEVGVSVVGEVAFFPATSNH